MTDEIIEEITVHAYDWKIRDKYDEQERVNIHAWCLDQNSKPYLLRFKDFPAVCTIELPEFIGQNKANWNKEKVETLYNALCKCLDHDAPFKYFPQRKKKLYYYRGEKTYPMMLLLFKNLNAMKHCKNFLKEPRKFSAFDNKLLYLKVWETQVPLERKLLTVLKLNYSQWFRITGQKIVDEDQKISTLENEYIVNRHSV